MIGENYFNMTDREKDRFRDEKELDRYREMVRQDPSVRNQMEFIKKENAFNYTPFRASNLDITPFSGLRWGR